MVILVLMERIHNGKPYPENVGNMTKMSHFNTYCEYLHSSRMKGTAHVQQMHAYFSGDTWKYKGKRCEQRGKALCYRTQEHHVAPWRRHVWILSDYGQQKFKASKAGQTKTTWLYRKKQTRSDKKANFLMSKARKRVTSLHGWVNVSRHFWREPTRFRWHRMHSPLKTRGLPCHKETSSLTWNLKLHYCSTNAEGNVHR